MNLVSKGWILFFFRVSMQGPCFTAVGEDGGDKRLVEPDLLAKLMVLHHQILFSLATAAISEAILMRTSDDQVPHLCTVFLLGT